MRIFAAFAIVSCVALGIAAQDPDPNSPTPVFLTDATSTRALAQTSRNAQRGIDPSKIRARAFLPNSSVVLYVTNLDLMDGEGANAFRVNAEDELGHKYRFPVTDIRIADNARVEGVYAVTIVLTDEIGYWDPPVPNADLLLHLTWRGLSSNGVKIGLGHMGGNVKDDPDARPAPLGSAPQTTSNKEVDSPSPEFVGYRFSGDRRRFLEQATFGPTQALDDRIRRIGLRTWLAEQFAAPYPTNPYPNQPLKPNNPPTDCDGDQVVVPDVPATCFRDTYTLYPLQTWNSAESLYGTAPLRHRVSWGLSQIWVTSGVDVQQSRHMVEYHKILSNNAFGNFRNLMQQMTLSPTMGDYLSMSLSTKNSPNENYAREIMQLFTVGLFLLNPDGTYQLDGSGNPIPTYDQNNVNNLTKVLTGWSFCNTPAVCPNIAVGTVNYIDPMLLNTGNHDLTAKTLLNYPGANPADRDILACTGCTGTAITTYANASLNHALDNIFNHPNVGPYISRTLIQQMVTSFPTAAYVGRVATVFNDNGSGVRGDMKAVVKAILLDPEARGDAKSDPNFGKLREPFQFATNLMLNFNVRSANGSGLSDGYLLGLNEYNGMAQIPFRSPTVFNYFPPGYIIPGTGLLGPEFALMTTGTAIQRANFVNRMVFTAPAIPTSPPTNQGGAPNGTSLDFSDLQALVAADTTGNTLVDELNRRLMHGTMSASMKSTILTAVTNIASSDTLNRARQAVYLVATSSQYQVQR